MFRVVVPRTYVLGGPLPGVLRALSERYPSLGGYCVPDGQEPKKGYARYPRGLVPEYLDEQDACDAAGRCEGGPLAIECPRSYPDKPCRMGDHVLPVPERLTRSR